PGVAALLDAGGAEQHGIGMAFGTFALAAASPVRLRQHMSGASRCTACKRSASPGVPWDGQGCVEPSLDHRQAGRCRPLVPNREDCLGNALKRGRRIAVTGACPHGGQGDIEKALPSLVSRHFGSP
ncbi:hypothetical protein, partial [Paracoccus pantotrophus]|uniref:hypothetical protein n=1 Tax=Paracoccus pantotrophus TaxID=82367 RepID=UPI0023E41463